MPISPAQRSLKYLRDKGYTVAITEKWNPHARVRQDLFGFVDLLAVRDGQTLAVQTTSASNLADRRKKVIEHENLPILLSAGWQVVIHGWRKNSQKHWVVREDAILGEEDMTDRQMATSLRCVSKTDLELENNG